MRKLYTLFLVVTFCGFTQAQTTLTQWTFENVTTPSTGTGTMSIIGGTNPANTSFPSGSTGLAYSIKNFPNDTSNSGTAGFRFNTSTAGYNGITVSFYVNGHNQSSRWQQYEYSTNGGSNWTILNNNNGDLTTAFGLKSITLPASCDNNPNFAFRIVSIFQPPANSAYQSIQGGGYNGNNGYWNIDSVTFSYNTLSTSQNQIAGLKLYPNPVKEVLHIESNNTSEKSIELFNVLGKSVYKGKTINNSVNLSNVNKGVYIAKITEEEKTVTRKIVIN